MFFDSNSVEVLREDTLTDIDDRWGSYLPWFLRAGGHSVPGNLDLFFSRLSQRLERLIQFNEAGIPNLVHFGAWLESESLQRFRYDKERALADQIAGYYNPANIRRLAESFSDNDQQEVELRRLRKQKGLDQLVSLASQINKNVKTSEETAMSVAMKIIVAERNVTATKKDRINRHFGQLVANRLTALEALLRILPKQNSWFPLFVSDVRRSLAEASVPLDIRGDPPLFVPLDEPLLQREVIDAAFHRLSIRFPERAQELATAYHDLLSGKKLDSVFSEAFKTLEETARSLTGCNTFVFDKKNLKAHFPKLHGTIHETIIRLAGHRGDEAGHARSAPDVYEMRYLLFAVCNITILMLDYYDSIEPA